MKAPKISKQPFTNSNIVPASMISGAGGAVGELNPLGPRASNTIPMNPVVDGGGGVTDPRYAALLKLMQGRG